MQMRATNQECQGRETNPVPPGHETSALSLLLYCSFFIVEASAKTSTISPRENSKYTIQYG